MKVQCSITTDRTEAEEILQMKEQNLLKPEGLIEISESEINQLMENGFVIGDHTDVDLLNWIEDSDARIYVARSSEEESILGFAIILEDDKTKEKINNYTNDMTIKNNKFMQIVKSEKFVYLIQILINKQFIGKGIGTALARYIIEKETKPIISYVIKQPIMNKASVYFHLKTGFEYVGTYNGEYGGFNDYQSICFLHENRNVTVSKEELNQRFQELVS